ncbi:hypothetical protein D3218_13850 [Aureimonas flava]|uniref:Uncharacterized protein n=1 Tax=Aureimonas flava TaxID=2320271 RepID=A0A3A1WPU2_9HYPH|nr:hypothetical protein [Aureimonas flava]RIX99551.1 hypothetical protein D3218_13850 [Aureimonas flava]
MARGSKLPEIPDFDSLETAAAGSHGQRTELFGLIGNLVYTWSNNESLLVYLVMLLLQTDRPSALIVFGTLNTTRARVDLVQRLARVKVQDRELQQRLKGLMARFDAGTRLRNEYLHAMFSVDEAGRITHTHAMRIEERGRTIRFGTQRAMDEERLEALRTEIRSMNRLNREFWLFLSALEAHLDGGAKGEDPKTR